MAIRNLLGGTWSCAFWLMGAFTVAMPVAAVGSEESLLHRVAELERALNQSQVLIQQLSVQVEQLQQQTDHAPPAVDDVDDRISDLEIAYEDIGDRTLVRAFESEALEIGGFLHTTLTSVDGEDGNEASFNRHVFELLVHSDLDDDWSAFVASAFFNQSDVLFDDNNDGIAQPQERLVPSFAANSRSPLVLGWANYRHNDQLNVRIGRFVSPHGIVNIEHFPALLTDAEQPQFLRPFGGQTLFPNFVNGLSVHGRRPVGDGEFSYDSYAANFVGNLEDFVFGGRVAYAFPGSTFTVGLNASAGARSSDLDSDYEMVGVDWLAQGNRWRVQGEAFVTAEDSGEDRLAYYLEPVWRLASKWSLFLRHDFLDYGQDLGDRVENVFGVNYTPKPNIRMRGTVTNRQIDAAGEFPAADVVIYQLSATLSF